MAKLIIILICLFALCLTASAQTNNVQLSWTEPSITTNWPLAFIVQATNNIAGLASSNCPTYVFDQTNCNPTVLGTNINYAVPFLIQPAGSMFFVCTASNFWGYATSNIASTPPVLSPFTTTILRTQ